MRVSMIAALVLLVGIAAASPTSPAFADRKTGEAGATKTTDGGVVEVRIPGATSPGIPRSGSGTGGGGGGYAAPPMVCTDFTVGKGPLEGLVPTAGRGTLITDLSTLRKGDEVWVECRDPDTGVLRQQTIIRWDPADPGALAAPIGIELGQQALRELVIPPPAVRTWPPAGRILVGLETWFHVDPYTPDERTAVAGPVASTVRAEPVRVVWHLGETDLTCTTAGTVWANHAQTTDCGYEFHQYTGERTGAAANATVDVVYHVTWSSTVAAGGDLGEVTRTTAFPFRVWEAQAVIE